MHCSLLFTLFVQVTILTAPFAPPGNRQNANPTTDCRLIKQSHLLQKALPALILLHLHPKSKISMKVTVLTNNDGRLEAAINAATLALIGAGIPLKDMVCPCVTGRWDATGDDGIGVDLNRREIQNATGGGTGGGSTSDTVCLPVAAMPQRGAVVLAQQRHGRADDSEAGGED